MPAAEWSKLILRNNLDATFEQGVYLLTCSQNAAVLWAMHAHAVHPGVKSAGSKQCKNRPKAAFAKMLFNNMPGP
jgi:hypothetical protein